MNYIKNFVSKQIKTKMKLLGSLLSKIFFEKAMHTRLTKFIKKHTISYLYQFGFQSNDSTNQALIS